MVRINLNDNKMKRRRPCVVFSCGDRTAATATATISISYRLVLSLLLLSHFFRGAVGRLLRDASPSESSSSSVKDRKSSTEIRDLLSDDLQGYDPYSKDVDSIFPSASEESILPVFVGYNTEQGRLTVQDMTSSGSIPTDKSFDRLEAVAVTVTKGQLRSLKDDDTISYFEPDVPLSAHGEVVPWNIQDVHANLPFLIPSGTSSSCDDPSSFKVAIVDSGIDATGHNDFKFQSVSDSSIKGASFGTTDPWYEDTLGHGTQVAGVMAAIKNAKGIQGIVQDGNICLLVARVFADKQVAATQSDVMAAVRWAVREGARVINLSMGGPTPSVTASRFFKRVVEKKERILVASAGNDWSTTLNYPASYESVLSVGAVDENNNRAAYSNYNYMIDFVAPGSNILTTTSRGTGSVAKIRFGFYSVTQPLMGNSAARSKEVFGVIRNCPSLGKDPCPGDGGQICVIERGEISFEEKALNCQASGGVAAIIYNNENGPFVGGLPSGTSVEIPVATVSGELGDSILRSEGTTGAMVTQDGYTYVFGSTSIAAPHVTGAIAAAWRSCPNCSHTKVITCLRKTAIALGASGKDEEYGNGLVQAGEAYACLQKQRCCRN